MDRPDFYINSMGDKSWTRQGAVKPHIGEYQLNSTYEQFIGLGQKPETIELRKDLVDYFASDAGKKVRQEDEQLYQRWGDMNDAVHDPVFRLYGKRIAKDDWKPVFELVAEFYIQAEDKEKLEALHQFCKDTKGEEELIEEEENEDKPGTWSKWLSVTWILSQDMTPSDGSGTTDRFHKELVKRNLRDWVNEVY